MERIRLFFNSIIGVEWTNHLNEAVTIFAIVMVIGFLVKQFLVTIGRRISKRTETELDDRILATLVPRVKWVTIVVGLYLAADELIKGISQTDRHAARILAYADAVIYLALIFVVSTLLLRITDVSLRYLIERHAQKTSSRLNEAILPVMHRLMLIVIVVVGSIMVLGHFGVDVSSLLVFLGGSSVAIALAAQDTLQNMIAGFVIMLDRPFRVGDRIKLPTGEVGDVYEIGLRSTKVMDFDNNLIVSPNAELVKTKVVNFSYPGTEIRVLVEISVAYGTDLDRVRALLLSLAAANADVLRTPAPEVFVSALDDSGASFQLVARTDTWKKKWKAETSLRETVYNSFLKEGITFGSPRRTVQLSGNAAPAR